MLKGDWEVYVIFYLFDDLKWYDVMNFFIINVEDFYVSCWGVYLNVQFFRYVSLVKEIFFEQKYERVVFRIFVKYMNVVIVYYVIVGECMWWFFVFQVV